MGGRGEGREEGAGRGRVRGERRRRRRDMLYGRRVTEVKKKLGPNKFCVKKDFFFSHAFGFMILFVLGGLWRVSPTVMWEAAWRRREETELG